MSGMVEFKNLTLVYGGKSKNKTQIGPLNLNISENDFLGIVGESGAGKSTVGLALLDLLHLKGGRRAAGEIITEITPRDMAWIPQDPLSALDPLFSIASLLKEVEKDSRRISEALAEVYLDKMPLKSYAHELSGGMRQRLVIAMALLKKPKLLIADEPTSSLDVVLQYEIMQLFKRIHGKSITCVFITHNLPLAALFCKRLCVMAEGKIVEIGTPFEIMQRPQHEYTRQLVRSIPEFHDERT